MFALFLFYKFFIFLFLAMCIGTTFQTYVDANSKSFPCEVIIDTGYYGGHGKSSLYEEQLTLHFEMKLLTVRGKVDRGATYHIPLSSSLQFSLLHNPSDNIQQAMLGHYFETVGHILAQPSRNRPLVRCIHVHVHVCTLYICVYIHIYMYMYIYVHACVHISVGVWLCVHVCGCVSLMFGSK